MPSNHKLRDRCLGKMRFTLRFDLLSRKRKLVQCVLEALEQKDSYGKVDAHLCPQAMQLRSDDHHIDVAVFPMKPHLPIVLDYLQHHSSFGRSISIGENDDERRILVVMLVIARNWVTVVLRSWPL